MDNTTKENIIINNKYNKIIINNETTTIIKTKKYKNKNITSVKVMSTVKYIHMLSYPNETIYKEVTRVIIEKKKRNTIENIKKKENVRYTQD